MFDQFIIHHIYQRSERISLYILNHSTNSASLIFMGLNQICISTYTKIGKKRGLFRYMLQVLINMYIYDGNAAQTAILGFQHYIVMLGTAVMIASLVVPRMGGGPVIFTCRLATCFLGKRAMNDRLYYYNSLMLITFLDRGIKLE